MKPIEPERSAIDESSLTLGRGPGRALREARESLGLTVEQVAERLHLSIGTVQALEADDYAGLPPAIFVRGYLKNFARQVGLDQRSVVSAFDREWGPEASPASSQLLVLTPDEEPSRFNAALVSLMLAAFVGLGWWAYQSGRDQSPETDSAAISPGDSNNRPADVTRPVAPQDPPQTGSGVAAATPPSADAPPKEAAGVSSAPSVAASAEQEQHVTPAGVQSIVVHFQGESWVSVVDAEGTRLAYELGTKGGEKVVQGKAPFKLVLGRPAEIALEYNGKPYEHGYTDNRAPARITIGP
jgi:cytoskeleton protein RodZ